MKIKKLIFFFISMLIFSFQASSDEIEIDASNIDVKKSGNLIFAENTIFKIPVEKITIKSKKAEYQKLKNIIVLINDVYLEDENNNLIIQSQKLTYDRDKQLFFSEGETKINLENKYILKSRNLYFDRNLQTVYGSDDVIVEDYDKNFYKLKDNFKFDNLKKIAKSKKGYVLDNNDNKYIYEDLIIDFKNKKIIGKEIKVEFEKSYFGNKNNDPILKGRSSYSDKDELKIYKTVFSTCNINNKKCRGWEVQTDEFKHDKNKKIFEYKNSWLKIFDYKVFYLPYFNHPDPTVKRKSGFLTPSYTSSDNFGTSVNIPYYKILSVDKDITFNPKFYADKSFLLQNEYRQALSNSKILSDFSFLVGDAGTKGHLFFNQQGIINKNTKFDLNIQNVEGDNFLKNHKLAKTSNLIKDESLLLSNFDLNWNLSDANLTSSFKVYEDLTRNYHDRYQYIFPDFEYTKYLKIPDNYDGKFLFNSYGFNKNYDTNVHEAVITNDFLFTSNEKIYNSGIISKFDLLLKNSNSYSNNSSNFDENSDYNLYGTIKIDNSFPLQKITKNYKDYLKPVLSLRYSPNNNSDLSSKDILLDYDSAFNLNRIGSNNEVEGGESITLGLEYKKDRIYSNANLIDFKIANVIKFDENSKLPSKSRLNQKRSDLFGNLNYNINDNVKLGYKFSYDNNLEYSNLEALDLELSKSNFASTITYYTEDFDIDNKESIKNDISIKLNDENKLNFNLIKDLQNDYTQSYDINYEYLTDCLSLKLGLNKSFYSDGNLEPSQSISFLIKIIPFTDIGVANIGNIVKK